MPSNAVRTLPRQTQDQVLGELARNIVDGLEEDLSKITEVAVWAKCKELDDSFGDVYRDDDPKKVEDVQSWVQVQPPLPPAPAQPIPPPPAPPAPAF